MEDSLHSTLSNLLGSASSDSGGDTPPPSKAAKPAAASSSRGTSATAAASLSAATTNETLHERVSTLESQLQRALALLEGISAAQSAAADAAKGTRKQMRQLAKHYEALHESYAEMAAAMVPPDAESPLSPQPKQQPPPPLTTAASGGASPPPSPPARGAAKPHTAPQGTKSTGSSQSQPHTPASTGSPSLPDTSGVVPPGASAQSRAAAASRDAAMHAVQSRPPQGSAAAVPAASSSSIAASPAPSGSSATPPTPPEAVAAREEDAAEQRAVLPASLELSSDSKSRFGIKSVRRVRGAEGGGWSCSLRFYNLPVISGVSERKLKIIQAREPAYYATHTGRGDSLFTMLLRLDYWRVRGNDFPRDDPPPMRSGEAPPPECPAELQGSRPDKPPDSETGVKPAPDGKAARSWVLYTSASLWKAFLKHTGYVAKPAMGKRATDVCWDLQWCGPTPVMMEQAAAALHVTCTYENWRQVYAAAAQLPLQHEPLPWEPKDTVTVHDDDSEGGSDNDSSSQDTPSSTPPTRSKRRGKKRRRSEGGSASSGAGGDEGSKRSSSGSSRSTVANAVRSALESAAPGGGFGESAPPSTTLPQREGRIQPAVKDKEKVLHVRSIAVPPHDDMSALQSKSAQLKLLPPSLRLPHSTQMDALSRRWTIRRSAPAEEAQALYASGGMLLCKLLPPSAGAGGGSGSGSVQPRYMHEVTGQTVFSTVLRMDFERLRAGIQPTKLLAQAQRAAAQAHASMNLTTDDGNSSWIIELLPLVAKSCVQIVDPKGLGSDHWQVQWSGPTPGQLEQTALQHGILLNGTTFSSVLRKLKASRAKA